MPVQFALILLAVLVAATAGAGWLLRARQGRARQVATNALDLSGVDAGPLGERATLVQFSTELCARCPQVRRLLHAVSAENDGVAFAEVDLTHRPDLAARLHILQTPTVFVLDADGLVHTRFGGVPRRDAVTRELHQLIGEPCHA